MFYTISQNNSGGSFIQDENVNHLVCVEADSHNDAMDKFESIVEEYNQYSCPCCGDYFSYFLNNSDGEDFISDGYGEDIFNSELSGFDKDYRRFIVIHYQNGDVKSFDRLTKEFV